MAALQTPFNKSRASRVLGASTFVHSRSYVSEHTVMGFIPLVRVAVQRGQDFCCKTLKADLTLKIVNLEWYTSSRGKKWSFFYCRVHCTVFCAIFFSCIRYFIRQHTKRKLIGDIFCNSFQLNKLE